MLVVIVTEEYQREVVSDSAAGLALDCIAGGREGLLKNIKLRNEGTVACVAWRFCRAERRSGVAAKFAREAARKIKTACPDSWPFQLPPPSTHFDILLTTCLVSVFPANRK